MRSRILGLLLILAVIMPLVLGGVLVAQGVAAAQAINTTAVTQFSAVEADLAAIQLTLDEMNTAFAGVPAALDAVTLTIEDIKAVLRDLAESVPPLLSFMTGFEAALEDTIEVLDELLGIIRSIATIQALPAQMDSVMDELHVMVDDLRGVGADHLVPMLWTGLVLGVWLAGVYVALVWRWIVRGWGLVVGQSQVA
jgi:hypothetical protein